MTEEEILDEHPDLEKADFPAVYAFAADAGRGVPEGPGKRTANNPFPSDGTQVASTSQLDSH
jgi:hypothetical protein